MKIEFEKLHIENFMSLGTVDIDFNSLVGFNTIVGKNNLVEDNAKSNGSGKSSIFEALVWCLTGETIRGNKDIVNNYSDGGAYVSTTFKCDGKHFIIDRYKEHKKFKTNLFISVDGKNVSGKGIRDTTEILNNYLPDFTLNLIGAVIVLGQGLPNKFTSNSPSARKEILEKLTKSDFMIEDLKGRVNDRKRELTKMLREVEDDILRAETKIGVNTPTIYKSVSELNQLADTHRYEAELAEYQESMKLSQDCMYQYDTELSKILESLDELNEKSFSTKLAHREKSFEIESKYRDKLSSIESEKIVCASELHSVQDTIQKARSITDICPTCGQKLPNVFVPDTSKDEETEKELAEKLTKLNFEYTNTLNAMNKELAEAESDFNEALKCYDCEIARLKKDESTARKSLNESKANFEKCTSEINRLQIDIATFAEKKKSLEETVARLNDENQHLKNDVEEYKLRQNNIKEKLAIEAQFDTALKRDFRGFLLKDIIEYIDIKSKEYCKNVFDTELITFELDGNNISISYNSKSYESLSGGEKQKVDIIIQLSIRDMLCAYTNFYTNIIVFDEIFDNLDEIGSHRIIDLITNRLNDISSVFIISHHAKELNVPYDNEIIVSKDECGVSHLI